ncbi:MAG: permease [Candidatus Omnitrophica bacterium]|nr:permease [Candidatus Omnitrophota bacterium]
MLQETIDWLTYSVLQLNPGSRLGSGINFFIYDSIKILLLLFLMISVIGFFRSYISQNKVKNWLINKGVWGNFVAALFGSVTPFCSCSSIPLFLGFVKAGIPLGITFSFLITSPLINEYLVVLMLGFFGWKITVLYVASGILIGVVSGLILGAMRLEKYLVRDLVSTTTEQCSCSKFISIKQRISFGISEAKSIVKNLWFWVLVGVGIGAIIHNYVPQETIQSIIGKTGILSVPIATIIGVPLYGNCAAIVPVAVVLFQKGIPLGTALAFMMATAALSLPEGTILKRAMKLRLVAIFFGITTLAIILTGYLFNLLQKIIV